MTVLHPMTPDQAPPWGDYLDLPDGWGLGLSVDGEAGRLLTLYTPDGRALRYECRDADQDQDWADPQLAPTRAEDSTDYRAAMCRGLGLDVSATPEQLARALATRVGGDPGPLTSSVKYIMQVASAALETLKFDLPAMLKSPSVYVDALTHVAPVGSAPSESNSLVDDITGILDEGGGIDTSWSYSGESIDLLADTAFIRASDRMGGVVHDYMAGIAVEAVVAAVIGSSDTAVSIFEDRMQWDDLAKQQSATT